MSTEERLARVEGAIPPLVARLDRVVGKLEGIEVSMATKQDLAQLRQELVRAVAEVVNEGFEQVDKRLADIEKAIKDIEP